MPIVRAIQTDFTFGQISPNLAARTDLTAYGKGCKKLENAYALPHGGARRRPGTYFISEINDSSQQAKLIPFVFSRTSAYILVMNGGKMQFITDGQYIEGEGVRYEIPIPYSEQELEELDYAQIGSTMYFAHSDHPPKVLTRVSDTDWVLEDVQFQYRAISDYWYETSFIKFKILSGTNKFEVGDQFVWTSGGSSWTFTGSGNGTIFGTTLSNGGESETWTVTCQYSDADRQEWTVIGSTSGESATTFRDNNYPSSVTLYEQRLYWAGTSFEPQTMWGSVIGTYNDLTLGARANDGVQFQIASNNYDQIIHLESAKNLLPLTYGGEFSVFGSDSVGITPNSVRISQQTFHGSSSVEPVRIGQEILFVQRGNKKVRAVSYSVTEDVNLAPDITVLSENITGEGIVDSSFQQDPDYVAWFVRNDGALLSLTHLRDFDVTAWAIHNTENGSFENIATIPEGQTDVTYAVVNRTINGNQVRYIEYLEYADEVYSDSSLTGSAFPAQSTWNGLDHLEGQTVTVVGDGSILPDVVVSGGQINLDRQVETIVVGLPYTTTIETLPPALNLSDGTNHGRNYRIIEADIRLQDTVGMFVNDIEVPFTSFPAPLDQPPQPYSGDLNVANIGWQVNANLVIQQRIAKPFNLLGIIYKVEVND